MNIDFALRINPSLEKLEFEKAIAIGESALKRIPETPFHAILDKSLLAQAAEVSEWVEEFFNSFNKNANIKALYFELNEFDINTDVWYIEAFAYTKDGGLNILDMEWLTQYERTEIGADDSLFQIDGLEQLQQAFETVELSDYALQNARDWCEQLVLARFMELMRAAHLNAAERDYEWANCPIYFTEHSYDFIVRSNN